MDKQATFDKVVNALMIQNERSAIRVLNEDMSTDHEQCQYRGPRGLKCAIGHLIPDELYDERMEAKGISTLFADYPSIVEILDAHTESEREFLIRLQIAHDEYVPEMWDKAFADVADDYELEFKPL